MKKQKLNREDYQFRKKTDEELIKLPGSLNGLDFLISNCENCTIWICDHSAQVFVDLSKNCKVYIGPVAGPVFVRKCENIQISSASSQLRISNSQDIRCCVYSQSDPALEKCSNITFAPYNFTYPQVTTHFQQAKLDVNEDKWSQIFDFNPNFEIRNWGFIHPSEYKQIQKQIDQFECEDIHPVPIPQEYGGCSTKPIIIGSEDANCQEKGGQGLDFIMGKNNIHQQQLAAETAFEQFEGSIQSNEAQENVQSVKTFSVFDELEPYTQKKPKHYLIDAEQRETERSQKAEKKRKAKEYLDKFMKDLQESVQQRKDLSRNVQKKVKEDKGQTWQFILKNIDQKNNKGEKDVTFMLKALKSKALD